MYPFLYCSHHRRDYKSEYKQRFRPFSQYEYLGDGRFVTNANGNGPVTTASKIKQQLALQPKATSLHGEPWYREVVELRKQANDYKVGTLHTCVPKILVRKAPKKKTCVSAILSVLWSNYARQVPAKSLLSIDTVGHINLSIVNWMNIYSSLIFFCCCYEIWWCE